MEPVYIILHDPLHGAGYFQDVLSRFKIPVKFHLVTPRQPSPPGNTKLSGLALFGGPLDLHDERFSWLQSEVEFVKRVIDQNKPVLGHGFGGEVVAAALQCAIVRNSLKQIGWFAVEAIRTNESEFWLSGVPDQFEIFKWHLQAFERPANAVRLFHSDWTINEAFAIENVLAFLGHLELTQTMLTSWLERYDEEVAYPKVDPRRYDKLSVNWGEIIEGPDTICANLDKRLNTLHSVADNIYGRWAERVLASSSVMV